jgi:ABC-2 type transport system ATP-binding protein
VALRAAGLRCRYPGTTTDALDVAALTLDGSSTGLVGVNGAGKTTLLATLAGVRRPQAGSVLLDGVDVYGPRRLSVLTAIGYMPQQLQLPGELAVRDALAYVAWLRGGRPAVASKRADALLEQVELGPRRCDRINRLSGGMQRRLTLATALVTAPTVLLLDEPTTGLDPEQRANVRELITALPGGPTVFISSHVMEDVERMTSDIVVLSEGRVVHHGPTDRFVEERGGPERSAEYAFLSTIARSDR